MAGISKREREDKARIEHIKARLAEPMALYLFTRLNASLTALQRVQDKRVAERRAKAAAARKAAEPRPQSYNVLPDNGRGPDRKSQPAPRLPVDPAWLPRPGESPAMTRARLEAMAAVE